MTTATVGMGCGDVTKESPDPVGALGVSIANIVAVPGVESITLTAVGPAGFTHTIQANERKEWRYLRTDLVPGSYTLSAVASGANAVTLYETGPVATVVTAGGTAHAVLVLHPSVPVEGVINNAPRFISIVTDKTAVLPTTDLQIHFTVADPEGDTMDLVGVDSCAALPCTPGSFAPTVLPFAYTTPNTDPTGTMIWTAPAESGLYTLRFVLTDGRQAASDFSIQVPVGEVTGDIEVDFRINMAPVVSVIAVTPLETGDVDFIATVADDYSALNAMTYAWSTDTGTCTGTFSDDAAATTFTLTSFASGSILCEVILTVTDEDQGVSVSRVFLNEDLVEVTAPPTLRSVFLTQTDAVAGDVVEFGVEADLYGVDLGVAPTFLWTLPGTLTSAPETNSGVASTLTWTAAIGELQCDTDNNATFSVVATGGNTLLSSDPVLFVVKVDPTLCLP